jgi:hypothetical protein
MPKEWNWGTSPLNHGLLNQTTSLFIWEYPSETLSNDAPNQPLPSSPCQLATTPRTTQLPISSLEVPPFSWAPPNLSPGGSWHTIRRNNLRLAAIQYSDPDKLIGEGIYLLKVHHQNSTAKGPTPKALQLLLTTPNQQNLAHCHVIATPWGGASDPTNEIVMTLLKSWGPTLQCRPSTSPLSRP